MIIQVWWWNGALCKTCTSRKWCPSKLQLFQNLLSHILIFSCWFFPCLCEFLLSYASKFVSFPSFLFGFEQWCVSEVLKFNLKLFMCYPLEQTVWHCYGMGFVPFFLPVCCYFLWYIYGKLKGSNFFYYVIIFKDFGVKLVCTRWTLIIMFFMIWWNFFLHCLKFQFMYFSMLLKMRPNEIHLGNEIHFVIKINSIDHQEVYKTKMRPNMTWVSTYIFLFSFWVQCSPV
jgi:hypothetical protein